MKPIAFALCTALLSSLSSAVLADDCLQNNLPGHEHFCLKLYEKDLRASDRSCRTKVDVLHVNHLKFQCTSGRNAGRDWEVWCLGDSKCNTDQHALCTYDPKRMNGALEWNPGQHCTEEAR